MSSTGMLCFTMRNAYFSPSYFPGIKLIVSPNGCFDSVVNEQPLTGVSGLILNRNTVHALAAPDTGVLMYYLDDQSALAAQLLAKLDNRPWLDMTRQLLALARPLWLPMDPMANLAPVAEQLLTTLFPAAPAAVATRSDYPIHQLLHFIDTHIQQAITLADLAPLADLSIERTRHLFGEKMGMPFSQYIIWLLLKLIIRQMGIQRRPLGEIARQYGFSDPSHFTRHFKRFLGIRPHMFFKASYQFLPR